MAHRGSFNFWDPNDSVSSSSDDDYTTPSSPSSSSPSLVLTPSSPQHPLRPSHTAAASLHSSRSSITTIRLPLQMSDDDDEDDDDPSHTASTPHSSLPPKAADEYKEEQPRSSVSSTTSSSAPSLSSSPPPIPARRRSSLLMPTISLSSTTPLPSASLTFPAPPVLQAPLTPSPLPTLPYVSLPPRPSTSPSPTRSLSQPPPPTFSHPPPPPPPFRPSSPSSPALLPSPCPSPPLLLSPSLTSFSSSLTHSFEPVSRQVLCGSYTTKRLASLLKKVAVVEEEYSMQLGKAMEGQVGKMDKWGGDAMDAGQRVWKEVEAMLATSMQGHTSYAHHLVTDCVLPLLEYHTEAEERRKELIAQHRQHSADMQRHGEDVHRQLTSTVKLVTQAKQQILDESSKGGAGALQKTLTKHFRMSVKAITANAVKAARTYSDSVQAANARQHKFVSTDLPQVFGGLEALERGRLELVKAKLLHSTDIQIGQLQHQLQQLLLTKQRLSQLDAQHSLTRYIETTVAALGPATPPPPFAYALGVSIKDMEEGRLDPPIPIPPPLSAGVFGVPLPRLLAREADTCKGDGLTPALLMHTLDTLRAQDGYEAEGIFRISIPKAELQQLRVCIDREDYTPLTSHPNPHASACVMKEWLRALPSPIIPDGVYAEAVAIGKEGGGGGGAGAMADACMGVWERVGEEEQRVLEVLGEVAERVMREEEKSRMSVDNLSIVFAPCLMRNRSEDMGVLLENTAYECKFVAGLLRGLVQRRERRRRVGSIGGDSPIALDFAA